MYIQTGATEGLRSIIATLGPVPRCQWVWVRGNSELTVTTFLDDDYVERISIDDE